MSVDIPHHRTLYDLHHKVNAKEQIVGWWARKPPACSCFPARATVQLITVWGRLCRYATGALITGSDALIHDFYASECPNPVRPCACWISGLAVVEPTSPCMPSWDTTPRTYLLNLTTCMPITKDSHIISVSRQMTSYCLNACMNVDAQVHLTVDTGMETGELAIAAFVARHMVLAERVLARHFQEVDCEVRTPQVETVGGERPVFLPCPQRSSVRQVTGLRIAPI